MVAWSGVVIGVVGVLGVVVKTLLVMVKKKRGCERKGLEEEEEKEDGFVPMLNLKVFSYKELQLAMREFFLYIH